MARPRTAQPIIEKIWSMRANNFTIDQITDALHDEVSRNTVAKYSKKWAEMPEAIRKQREPVDWAHIEDIGLPLESLPFLLSMWTKGHYFRADQPRPLLPSVQEVQWWWRLHSAAPDLKPLFMYPIAYDIVLRERWAVATGRAVDVDDVWAYLAWGGWKRGEEEKVYENLVSQGIVPAKKLVMDFAYPSGGS
jgi:hypothetical protein